MYRTTLKITAWLMLAALMVPALASASVDACIAACSGQFMAADDAHCLIAAQECHPSSASVSSDCCAGHAAPSHASGHSESACSCPTCSLAPSRFFTDRAPVKLLLPAPIIASATIWLAPATVTFVHANAARCARIRTGPTQAQLCIFLR